MGGRLDIETLLQIGPFVGRLISSPFEPPLKKKRALLQIVFAVVACTAPTLWLGEYSAVSASLVARVLALGGMRRSAARSGRQAPHGRAVRLLPAEEVVDHSPACYATSLDHSMDVSASSTASAYATWSHDEMLRSCRAPWAVAASGSAACTCEARVMPCSPATCCPALVLDGGGPSCASRPPAPRATFTLPPHTPVLVGRSRAGYRRRAPPLCLTRWPPRAGSI
jgi:hypothetical protein